MAIWPCQLCSQRYTGDARNLYLTYYVGDESAKMRFVICPSCVEEVIGSWLGKALHRSEDGSWCDPDPEETLEVILVGQTGLPAAFRR